jgi:hypothetical protein
VRRYARISFNCPLLSACHSIPRRSKACRIRKLWFHICCTSWIGSPSDSHCVTAGAPSARDSVIPWHTPHFRASNVDFPDAACPDRSKNRAE